MTIAEVAQKYGLTPDTLRYHERMGLLPAVQRTMGGIRNYSETDFRWVEYIRCMRSAGVSIETLAEYVRLFQQGPGNDPGAQAAAARCARADSRAHRRAERRARPAGLEAGRLRGTHAQIRRNASAQGVSEKGRGDSTSGFFVSSRREIEGLAGLNRGAIPHNSREGWRDGFASDANCRFRRRTGGTSRKLQAADGVKASVSLCAILCGIVPSFPTPKWRKRRRDGVSGNFSDTP